MAAAEKVMRLTAMELRWLSTLYRTWWLTFWHPEVSSASDARRLATTCGKRVLRHPNSFAVNRITSPATNRKKRFPRCSPFLSLIDSHHSTLLFTYPVRNFTFLELELQKKTRRNPRSAQVQDLGQNFVVAAENELQCQGGGGGGGSSIRRQIIDQHAIDNSVDGVGDASEAQEKSVCKIGNGRWTGWVGGWEEGFKVEHRLGRNADSNAGALPPPIPNCRQYLWNPLRPLSPLPRLMLLLHARYVGEITDSHFVILIFQGV